MRAYDSVWILVLQSEAKLQPVLYSTDNVDTIRVKPFE